MTLRWHPFQLRPGTPEEGMPLAAVLPPEYLKQAEERLRAATAEAGLPYQRCDRVPNTHLAHEAAMYAEELGRGNEFHRAVLRRYFGEAGWIGGVDELVGIGREVGLDGDGLRDALTSRRYRHAVDEALAEGVEAGVSAVPAFVFAPGAMLSGAQPYPVFEHAMTVLGVPRRQGSSS